MEKGLAEIKRFMNISLFKVSEEKFEIFGRGGGQKLAEEHEVPFLGEVPLDTSIREGGDTGAPIVATSPDSPAAQAFTEIAKQVAAKISINALAPVG